VRSPPETQESSLLRWWPAMRAHPTWQRPLDVTSSFFSLFWPSSHKHLACYMSLPRSHLQSLASNYRNFIRIIITKRRCRRTRLSRPDPTNTPDKAPSTAATSTPHRREQRRSAGNNRSATDLTPRTGRSDGSVLTSRRLASRFEIAESPPRPWPRGTCAGDNKAGLRINRCQAHRAEIE